MSANINPISPNSAKSRIRVREMHQFDLDAVVRIENASFDHPWQTKNFYDCLCLKNVAAFVAEVCSGEQSQVVGYKVCQLTDHIDIINLAVAPSARRNQIASAMIATDVHYCHQVNCGAVAVVSEKNLAAQLFFRSAGFVCERIVHGFYTTFPDMDAYRFVYQPAGKVNPLHEWANSKPGGFLEMVHDDIQARPTPGV